MRYTELFLSHVKDARIIGEQLTGRCPFHKDKNPSFSVNLVKGIWQCFGCHLSGNAKRFKQLIGASGDKLVIPPDMVKEYHRNLMANKAHLTFLKEKRGLSLTTIKRWLLGHDGNRFTIPIYDAKNDLVNIRRYKPGSKGADKMISFAVGYGKARLFPIKNLRRKRILLVEGELDMLIANQYNFNAMTVTSGAGIWSDDFTSKFKDKDVIICFDVDKAGISGAQRVAKILKSVVSSLKIINLPLTEPIGADITNYFVDLGHKTANLEELIAKTPYIYRREKEAEKKLKCVTVSLAQAARDIYYFKPCKFDAHIIGKSLSPFIVPKKIIIKCNKNKTICNRCYFNLKYDEDHVFTLNPDDPFLLDIIDVSSKKLKQVIREKFEVHDSCKTFTIDVQEAMNVQEIRMIPTITYSVDPMAHEHVIRQGFYTELNVMTNTAYVIEAMTVPHPKDQHVTHLIYKAASVKDDISKFVINEPIKRQLRLFQPKANTRQEIYKKLAEFNDDITHNVTHIYKRDDLLTVINLVYHSVLRFKFQGRMLTKGWLEALIIGDTRTGKTETMTRLIEHYKAGELVTGENVSFAGLVGGLQQVSGQWMITWGKIPLNSSRLLVIDEMSALPVEIIERLSDVRSRGVAEITKIETERANAMTRLIWMSNARSTSALNSYDTGVLAVKELIGKPEDIARLDLTLTVASGEVPLSIINAVSTKKVLHKFTSEVCHNSVMFAWSRQAKHIKILKSAEHKILVATSKFAAKYSSQIPLVEPAEVRNKIAKVAVALACLLYSTKTGEDVVVRAVHVDVAAELLMSFYDKPSLGYNIFSRQFIMTDIKHEALHTLLNQYGQKFAENLLNTSYVTLSDAEDFAGITRQEAKLVISELVVNGAIKRRHGYYLKTPGFIAMLKKLIVDNKIKQRARLEEQI